MSVRVALAQWEWEFAAGVGVRRFAGAVWKGRVDRFGDDSVASHIHGAVGEYVVARLWDRHWSPDLAPNHATGDVSGWEVRTRTDPEARELIVRPDDPDNRVVILVRGTGRELDVVGWIRAGDAKQSEWRRETFGRVGYWVPVERLTPAPQGTGSR